MSARAGLGLLAEHLRGRRAALVRLAAWTAVEAAPLFAAGMVLARALDGGFLAGRPWLGLAWLGALALVWAVSAVGTRHVYPWLAATVEPLRDGLVTTVVGASLRRAVRGEGGRGGASVAQATEEVEAVRALVSTVLRNVRQLVSAGVAALAGLLVLSPPLALVVLAFVVLAAALFVLLLPVLVARYRRVVLAGERVGAVAEPVVSGIRDVVACAAEPRAQADIDAAAREHAVALRSFARAQVWRLPVITLGVHLPMLALLVAAPWLVGGGHLTVGEVAGAVVYLSAGLQPAMLFLVTTGSTLVVGLAVLLGRLAEVADVPPGRAAPRDAPRRPTGYRLRAEGLTFAYSAHSVPVVRDLTLDLPEGEYLAVVGPSGGGKSTLVDLLAGLATPQRGQVRIGGVPVDELGEPALRELVAVIPQEAFVFAGTVRENLTHLRPEAGDAELDAAAVAVGVHELVGRLGGYGATLPPGGGDLSPGERQLIALARVYLSAAKVVLLDEATCHLDPRAEAVVERAFAEREGTLVVVAHRISSALRARRILLVEPGAAASGTHDELRLRSPRYAELADLWV